MRRKTPRLFVDQPALAGGYLSFTRDHAHYLLDVMRLKSGDKVLVFNGRDGEWHVELTKRDVGKRPVNSFNRPDRSLRSLDLISASRQ